MRRGRNKAKSKRTPGAGVPQDEFRKSVTPIVVICPSTWMANVDCFCSKTGQWQVLAHNPDTGKWWNRLLRSSRACHGPPKERKCHIIVVYDTEGEDNNNTIHNAVKRLGESIDIATMALLNIPRILQATKEFQTAMELPETVVEIDMDLLLSSYTELRRLWAFQDTYDNQNYLTTKHQLSYDQIPQICNEWSSLQWRWNGPKLKDLYQRLRRGEEYENSKDYTSSLKEEVLQNNDMMLEHLQELRRGLEEKAASLLADADTHRVADIILSGGMTPDENLFGRIHAWAIASTMNPGNDAKYLIVDSKNKTETTILDAYDYATASNCTQKLEQLKVVSGIERPREQFSIPLTSNAMLTASLIPALFPTASVANSSISQFDAVLGSHRCWTEHMALKAYIIYLFQGQPGILWDLSMKVVKSALPGTWGLLLKESPDESFLRALFHPDVVEAGRLVPHGNNKDSSTAHIPPPHFDTMSRIYTLGRFVRTLDESDILLNDIAICRVVASTMKLDPEQVKAVVHGCKSGPLSTGACVSIFHNKQSSGDVQSKDMKRMPDQAKEILGMLGLFLNHDRKSMRDASRIDSYDHFEAQTFTTNKALADCAMYCGTLRWVSEDDDDEEEGIWTCSSCLHRWQKRGVREAYQARKLMHPMNLTPFTREQYYDPNDWDNIMEATNGDISKLAIDFYWGRCSNEECGRVCQAVPRAGACADTDGIPLGDFPETVVLNDGYDTLELRRSLESLSANNIVPSDVLEKYFGSEEKLMFLPGPVRRRVRNCIDKSTYILPRGILCNWCSAVPKDAIDEYCPRCGTGFEPVFACIHYSCPQCNKHFCKHCLGIDGIHFRGVYNAANHACWKILGNRYSYHNKGFCAECNKERPWPKSHALVSAGPAIYKKALETKGLGISNETAIQMQSSNLETFTKRYKEAVEIFQSCAHTVDLGSNYCHCGADVDADQLENEDY